MDTHLGVVGGGGEGGGGGGGAPLSDMFVSFLKKKVYCKRKDSAQKGKN